MLLTVHIPSPHRSRAPDWIAGVNSDQGEMSVEAMGSEAKTPLSGTRNSLGISLMPGTGTRREVPLGSNGGHSGVAKLTIRSGQCLNPLSLI